MSKFILFIPLLMIPKVQGAAADSQKARRIEGIIYFTNNTPRNLDTFPIELYSRADRERNAARSAGANGVFKLTGIKLGKYLLRLTWPPDRCTLRYRVDVTKESGSNIRVIMDAACGSGRDGSVQDLPEN
jgi:hypothetical protein